MCIADWQVAKNLGIKRSELLLPALSVSVADNSSLELIGAHFLTITARSGHKSEQLVYFATDIGEFYLSKAALIDLAVIDSNFPQPGSCPSESSNPSLPYANQHEVDIYEVKDGSTSALPSGQAVNTPGQVNQQQSTPLPMAWSGSPMPTGYEPTCKSTSSCCQVTPVNAQGITYSNITVNNQGNQDIYKVHPPGNWEGVTCDDLGPDDDADLPTSTSLPTEGASYNEVQGEYSSGLQHQATPNLAAHSTPNVQVQYDAKGRELAQCGCLKRTSPPLPPAHPPMPLTPQNIPKIEKWILEYYASSAFNVCEHQPLPKMTGLPPLRIHVKESAVPVTINKPSTIPAHWVEQVRKDIERDIELGVLERVPSNTPTTWCSRMHVISKKSGEPRRVVDLRAVNSLTARQTHTTELPFRQATTEVSSAKYAKNYDFSPKKAKKATSFQEKLKKLRLSKKS